MRDGLRLSDVKIKSAVRKKTKSSSETGLVVAKCKSHDDKREIMLSKNKLKDSRNYKDVFISHDQSREERLNSANFRKIIKIIGQDNVYMKGNKVYTKPSDRRDQTPPGNNKRQAPGNERVQNSDTSGLSSKRNRDDRYSPTEVVTEIINIIRGV